MMKCPRCGREMVKDNHRKYDLMMCYECGYIEGRDMGGDVHHKFVTNYERLNGMNFNEAVSFLSEGLGIDENKLSAWLDNYVA